ncbi:hypothetical protein HMPREF9080_02478 [Cardiobacterium valvarum F0432]|uniref:Uncharacterized protein n=1 Tax=Cardiobacterium valvarum F0432 TaxID=797473 RepID=G9ZI68_9GAMM|nr:hypothetical protein HMPREF9080_02478 [Cardiobacterium valvarum F0432]
MLRFFIYSTIDYPRTVTYVLARCYLCIRSIQLAGGGGRRPEGGDKKPVKPPLGGPGNHAAWRGQYLRRLTASAIMPLGGSSNDVA